MSRNAAPDPVILGAKPLGITKKVTTQIIRGLLDQLGRSGYSGTVRSIRFIPSSRSMTDGGAFQVLASTLIDIRDGADSKPRPQPLESVVTVGRVGGSQTLEALKIPALRHRAF